MTADSIIFEQMKLSDRADVLAFLHAAYPDTPRQSDPDFWDWHYLDHPNCEAGKIPIWLAKSEGRIVGQLATVPVELNVGERAAPAIWIIDLMVDPEFRRRGIMKKLVLEANKDYAYMLGSATRKQHSAALLTTLGWSVFSEIPRFHKLLFPGTAAKQLARSRPLRAAADIAFAPFRPRSKKIARMAGEIRAVESIDDSFDDLWSESRSQWGCSISRSSKYLNWQFTRQPGKRFDVLGYYENGKLLGYAVMFFRRASDTGAVDKAAISDICYHPDHTKGTVDALLAAALQLAIERRAGGLVTDAIDALLHERLRHFGFWRVKSGLELMAIGPEHHELLYDARYWHLTRGDSDISIFEQPNL